MRSILCCCIVASMSFGIAQQAGAYGNDISWNDCVGSQNATFNKNFSCDPGAQNENSSLMFQFKSPLDLPNFVAATFYFDIRLEPAGHYGEPVPPPLSPFWHYESGGCNRTGIAISHAIPASCADRCYADLFRGGIDGVSAVAAYAPDYQIPGTGHFVLLAARGDPMAVKAGVNYFGVELFFNNRNRATCVGCGDPKVGILTVTRLESNDGSPPVDLTGSDKFSDCVSFNGASPTYCSGGYVASESRRALEDPPCGPTAVIRRTWGTLKSLYR